MPADSAACRRCKREMPPASVFCPWCGTKQSRSKYTRTRPNGTGYAYKRNRTWTACVTVGWKGKKRITRTKGGFATKREALEYCQVLKRNGRPEVHTLDEYWKLYQPSLEKLSDSKQTAYAIAYNKLDAIKHISLAQLGIHDLQAAVKGLTYYPARDIKVLLTHLYKRAGAEGVVSAQLPSFIELPKLEAKEGQAFTKAEIGRLWEVYEGGEVYAGYILLMIYSGMMPGELRGLEVSMIDLQNKRITGAGLKTANRRTKSILLADYIIPVVEALMGTTEGPKLLPGNADRFYRAYYSTLDKANCRRLPPYSCRHSTATALATDANIAQAIIARVMRHSERMVSHYSHPDENQARNALNSIRTPYNEPGNVD